MYLFGYCLEVNLLLVRKVDQIQFCRLPYHVKYKVVQIQFFEALSTIGLPWLSSFYKVWECSWRFQCPPEVSFYFCRLRKVQEVSVKFSPSWLSLVGGYCSLRAWGNEPRFWSGDGSLLFLAAWCRKPWVLRRGFLVTFVAFGWELNLQFSFVLLLLPWFSFVDVPLVVPANLVKPSLRGYFVAIRNLEISEVLAYWSYCTKY